MMDRNLRPALDLKQSRGEGCESAPRGDVQSRTARAIRKQSRERCFSPGGSGHYRSSTRSKTARPIRKRQSTAILMTTENRRNAGSVLAIHLTSLPPDQPQGRCSDPVVARSHVLQHLARKNCSPNLKPKEVAPIERVHRSATGIICARGRDLAPSDAQQKEKRCPLC